jgi:hypothetical protein
MTIDFDNGRKESIEGLGADGLPSDPPGVLVDAEDDPSRFNALSAAALGEDELEDFSIDGPPDGSARLLAGYVDPSGVRHTTAEVRELRGRDEETLARALATGDLSRYIDSILRAGVIRLGELTDEKEIAKALDTLIIGDRDLLVLQIRRLAYGDTLRLNVKCPFCEDEFEVDYSFSNDVSLKPFKVEGSGDRNQRLYDIELPSGRVAEVRLVDGAAQKRIYNSDNAKKTGAELNTLLLRELVSTIDGVPVRGAGPILDMTLKDRSHLLTWLVDGQPGPQYDEVKQDCPDCQREFPLVVTIRDMFRG